MKAYLLVNHFAHMQLFSRVGGLFEAAAEKQGISLEKKTAGELLAPLGEVTVQRPDFVLFFDKDVHLARHLENAGWRLFNSSKTVAVCDNKADTSEALLKAGLPMPKTVIAPLTFSHIGYTNTDFIQKAGEWLGYPMVIKELYGSLGEQVYLACDLAEAEQIVAKISPRPFLFQEFVRESAGRDIRVNVVGGCVIAAMERTSSNGDFRSNIGVGGAGRLVHLSEQQKAVAIAAADAVGADFAGVDLLLGKDGPLVCEVNSNPQFAGTYDFCGVNLGEDILAMIQRKIQQEG